MNKINKHLVSANIVASNIIKDLENSTMVVHYGGNLGGIVHQKVIKKAAGKIKGFNFKRTMEGITYFRHD